MNHSKRSFRIARGVLLFVALVAGAADKSGVSPNSISLPKGPGSIEGLGESFQPTLNTGTAKHGIDLQLPPGTAGHEPALSLIYDGGGANGPVGYGWNLTQPLVQRRTDKGIPTYGEKLGVERPDVFINEQREELVPGSDGYFRCANESAFVRYRPVADHWEATRPNGTRLEFGITAAGRIAEGTSGKVFAWLLERETDTRGNVIEYEYRAFDGEAHANQKYLAAIRYGPGAPPRTHYHFVAFEYEDRPDWFEDARAGFLVRTGKRLKTIVVGTQGVELAGHLAGDFDGDGHGDSLNRRYELDYLQYAGDASHWSLLSRVSLVGADGATALPPAVFDYAVSNPAAELSAQGQVWGGVDEPIAVMDSALVDLVDLNGDGLADVLKTESGGGVHTAWVNRGPMFHQGQWAVAWAAPEAVDPGLGTAWNFDLASERTHLADMDGDGLSDLVHRSGDDTVFYFLNRGRLAWGERRDMSVQEAAPPSPFGNPNVRTADLDFDKRMDIVQSVDLGGGMGYRVWFNLGSQAFTPSLLAESSGGFDLALPGVQIADCNGDRVPDVARIQSGAVFVAAGLGYGRFAEARAMVVNDVTLEETQIANAKLTDINGDGLADLVLERGAPGECWYWLNQGNYTLSERKRIVDLPVASAAAAVRWADLNGNGTTDLVYADAQSTPRIQLVELGELVSGGLAPNLMRRIENGIGRVTELEYAPSTRFALEDAAAGTPWPEPLPFPVTVVASVRVSDSLGHEYETRFRYHDGYYDPVEKQFRGFGRVEQIDVGDPTAPTLVSRSEFDTGRTSDAMKGRLLRFAAETEAGEVFSTERTLWADPPRVLMVGTNGESVRFAHPVGSIKEIIELGQGTPRRLESEVEFDDHGNQTRMADYGVVEGGDRSAWDDERVVVTEYALNLEGWIIRMPMRSIIQDEEGIAISRSELFYDDESFAGDNLGIVRVGNLTMQRDWIDPEDSGAYVETTRTAYDPRGNPIRLFDPLANPGIGDGHHRELDYDPAFRTYPITETIHLGGGSPALVYAATYDVGLATVLTATDFNLNTTAYDYDALGRLISVVSPGDSAAYPTSEYDYVLALPTPNGGLINYVETRRRDRPDAAGSKADQYWHTRAYRDGLGRVLMTRTEAEPDAGTTGPRVVVSEVTRYNARLGPSRVLNPFFTVVTGNLEQRLAYEMIEEPGWQGRFHYQGNLIQLDLANAHQTFTTYDATLKVRETVQPDGTTARREYEPLLIRDFDANDNDSASPYAGTPTVMHQDGLGRLIRVDETTRMNDDGSPSGSLHTWTTQYRYDLNDQLTRITDSQNNVKELRYDGLRRRTWIHDPDAGITTNVYDAASNVIATTDAKGQTITYTYDGANRVLTEDYLDGSSPEFSYGRTPDVAYHYDLPAGAVDQGDGTTANARHVRGRLAWVADNTGQEHSSFDERGRTEWTVKRIVDPVLSPNLDPDTSLLVAYRTGYDYDSMDRVRRLVYPDRDEVTYEYNERNLLSGITGGPSGYILSGLRYAASGHQERIGYGNGVGTSYAYDARIRLTDLTTVSPLQAAPLIHFRYDLDPVSNIRSITDLRPVSTLPADDPRRNTQHFEYDDLYRLTQVRYNSPNPATANGGVINYLYDRIGNLLAQTSDLSRFERGVPVTDLGTLDYGGTAGRSGRTGRGPTDPPGPHALTSIPAINSPPAPDRQFTYDANGNMRVIDGMACTWDFRDRLVVVEDAEMRADYRYDYTGRRILKRVTWKQGEPGPVGVPSSPSPLPATTSVAYPASHFEVRDHDQPAKFVFHGAIRVAKITTAVTTNLLVQRLRLRQGWNLVSMALTLAPTAERLLVGPVVSALRWIPAEFRYAPVTTEDRVESGTVLWVKAATDAMLALPGEYLEPVSREVPVGESFLGGMGLETWSLDLPASVEAWFQDAAFGAWRTRLGGDLQGFNDLPTTLAPGEALWVRTAQPIRLAPAPATARIVYYHGDHLGSANTVTDAAGALVAETAHLPYGLPRHHYEPEATATYYGFTQKERDRESGLHYFEARHLVAGLARFATPDPKYQRLFFSPADLPDRLEQPQQWNLYAYVSGNPVKYVDPSGLESSPSLVETVDDFSSRMGFLSDLTQLETPGTVFNVIGLTIKTGQLIDNPSGETAAAAQYEGLKWMITGINLPAGLTMQALDFAGVNPNTVLRPAIDKALDKVLEIETGYREVAETYKDAGRNYQKATASYQQASETADKLIKSIEADTARIRHGTRELERQQSIPTAEVLEQRMVSDTARQFNAILNGGGQ